MVPPADAAPRFAAFAQVGPGDKAVADAADLLDSLWAHEPTAEVVLVDDVPGRDLAGLLRSGEQTRVIGNPRGDRGKRLFGGMACGTFAGLREAGRDPAGEFVVKLDCDALVIAPFARRLAEVARLNPDVGMIGAYRMTPNGTPRGFSDHAAAVRLLGRRFLTGRDRARCGRWWPTAIWGRAAALRRLVISAESHGYEHGEHCLGGAYAITRAGLNGLADTGAFADPLRWLDVEITEDVAASLHVRAAGRRLLGHVDDGQVFGTRYVGLPGPPQELLDRGFGIIHSVKNDPQHAEANVREFFRRHRRSGESRGVGAETIADLASNG